jgi:hypothetical protein
MTTKLDANFASATVGVTLGDGTTYEFALRGTQDHPLTGTLEINRPPRETTYDDPDVFPSFRTFAPGPDMFITVNLTGHLDGNMVLTRPASATS